MEHLSFDILVRARRSCRSFQDGLLDEAAVASILEAGWLAPHAGATGVALANKRRFFVIRRASAAHDRIYALALARVRANRHRLMIAGRFVPGLAKKTASFMKRLDAFDRDGIRTLQEAPVLDHCGGKKGLPAGGGQVDRARDAEYVAQSHRVGSWLHAAQPYRDALRGCSNCVCAWTRTGGMGA